MSQEVLIPKMKRNSKKHMNFRIQLLNLVLIIFSVMLIITSTFINIDFSHYIIPSGLFSGKILEKEDFVFSFGIIPQIPVLLFICSALGKKMAITSVCLYILIGLFFLPVFALGGGLRYFGQYSFGYILAYIPAVVIAGNFLNKKYSFLYMFLASISGVLIIHFIGSIYMILIALIKHSGFEFIKSWLCAQSGLKIIYDFIFSFLLVLVGKHINEFIKFVK